MSKSFKDIIEDIKNGIVPMDVLKKYTKDVEFVFENHQFIIDDMEEFYVTLEEAVEFGIDLKEFVREPFTESFSEAIFSLRSPNIGDVEQAIGEVFSKSSFSFKKVIKRFNNLCFTYFIAEMTKNKQVRLWEYF